VQQAEPHATRRPPQGSSRSDVPWYQALWPMAGSPAQGGMRCHAPIQPQPTVAYSGHPRSASGTECGADHRGLVWSCPPARC